ncbi:putative invertase inhibitor [Aristolochia californica]|uniref:putative invertase inhibitor n=1 Tax=Aristolochia californica TaxID=171875 RepID=UPI0035D75029
MVWTALRLSLALAVAAVICSGSSAASANLATVCKKADHQDLCYSAAKHIFKTETITPAGATKASILVTLDSTKQAKNMATTMTVKVKSKDSMESANFNVCLQLYDDAIRNLQKSLENLSDGALSDLKINLSAVLTDYSTCDDAFAEVPGLASPLGKINSQLNMLTRNNLALASVLQ